MRVADRHERLTESERHERVRESVQPLREPEPLERRLKPRGIGGLLRPARIGTGVGAFRGPVYEGRDVADLRTAKRQHVEREGVIALILRIEGVETECGLPVRVGAEAAPAPVTRQRRACQEDSDRLAAAKPGAKWRDRKSTR